LFRLKDQHYSEVGGGGEMKYWRGKIGKRGEEEEETSKQREKRGGEEEK